jgi:photosystem II stability/assembly factor-like uncharacterized protein
MAYSMFAGAGQWRAVAEGARASGFFGFKAETKSWVSLSEGLPDDVEVRFIQIHPTDQKIVYIGTQVGVYRTDDGGETWRALSFPEGTSDVESLVWSICLEPGNPDTLYAGTQGTCLFRSTNAGASWQRLAINVPPGAIKASFSMRVIRISVSANDPKHIHVAFEIGGMMRSLDGGESWQSCNETLLELAGQDHLRSAIVSKDENEGMLDSHSVATSPAHPDTLWLANRMGLFRSDDKGDSWNEFGIGRFSPLTYARDVKVSSHDGERMYAALSVAAASDEGSLYRSDDFGETWARFDKGVSINSTLMIIAEGVTSSDRVYCAARRGQVLGTEDGGASWVEHPLPEGVEGVYSLACI